MIDTPQNKKSPQDLLNAIITGQDFENAKFTDFCNLLNVHSATSVLIKNCHWDELLLIKNGNFSQSISFINCTFDKGISLSTVDFNGKLIFKSCKINQEIILNECSFAEVNFEESHVQECYITGLIKNNAIKNDPIVVLNSTFEKLQIKEANLYKHFKLVSGSINELFIGTSNFYASLSIGSWEKDFFYITSFQIDSSKFYQRVDFLKGNVKEWLYIHKVEFKEQVVLQREFSFDQISFIEVKATHNVSLTFNDNLDDLNFQDCWFDTSFSLNCYKQDSFKKTLSIRFDGIINGNYIIEDVDTASVNISCINFGNIMFHNISAKFIWLDKFFNYNKLFFNNVKRHPNYNILIIFDSNVGNTEFENIDFRTYNEVVIAKSDVSSMLLTNSLLPKHIQIKTKSPEIGVEIGELEKINDNMYFRETYRQLKLAMEKAGNRYYSLVYKSKEMHYQRKELKFGWDKILLYINYYSNNYGISWGRGILFTLCVAYFSFILLNAVSSHPLFHWNIKVSALEYKQALEIAWTHFVKYISTFPVLKSDMQDEHNWKTDIVLMLSRIFIGIGIYQTIAAFRKYGK